MGMVALSTQGPIEGRPITATLTDDDGMVSGQMWQWQKSMDKNSWMDAMGMGAMTMSYTPQMADVGYYLRATVTYADANRPGRTAESMATDSMVVVNSAPEFAEDMTTREVPENSAEGTDVGEPVTATDANGDTLTYSLSGDDAMYFSIGGNTGQITVGADTMLDYETTTSYMVTVTATDANMATDSIEVTINVTDVAENQAPAFDMDATTRMIEENTAAGMNVGAPVTATDPNGDTLSYMLSGDDAMYFSIDDMGQITVGADTMLDYETTMSYMVTVTATDPDGESDSIAVTINVTNVVERSDAVDILRRYLAGDADVSRADAVEALRRYLGN